MSKTKCHTKIGGGGGGHKGVVAIIQALGKGNHFCILLFLFLMQRCSIFVLFL